MFDLNLGRVGLNPRPDYRPGQQAAPLDLVSFGGSLWVCTAPTTDAPAEDHAAWMPAAKGGLMRLTSDLTLYVREDGDDANTGLEDSPQGAFKTPQAALDAVAGAYWPGSHKVTVKIGPGTFAAFTCPQNRAAVAVEVQGSGDATVIAGRDRIATITFNHAAGHYILSDMTVSMTVTSNATSSRTAVLTSPGSQVDLRNVHFMLQEEARLTYWLFGVSCRGGEASLEDNLRFTLNGLANGTRIAPFMAEFSGRLTMNQDIVLSGNALTNLFLWSGGFFTRTGQPVLRVGDSYTASKRFDINEYSICKVKGAGQEFFPGEADGLVLSGALLL